MNVCEYVPGARGVRAHRGSISGPSLAPRSIVAITIRSAAVRVRSQGLYLTGGFWWASHARWAERPWELFSFRPLESASLPLCICERK